MSRNRYCAFEGKTPCSLAVQLSLSTTINCSAILTSPSVPGTVKYCFCGDKFIRIFMNSFVLNLKLLICFKHKGKLKSVPKTRLMIDFIELCYGKSTLLSKLSKYNLRYVSFLYAKYSLNYYDKGSDRGIIYESEHLGVDHVLCKYRHLETSTKSHDILIRDFSSLIPCNCDIFYCIFGFVLFFILKTHYI